MGHIVKIVTEPVGDVWRVIVSYAVGPDVVDECVSEDHARLVMQNRMREGFLESSTKVFACDYNPGTRRTVHSRA